MSSSGGSISAFIGSKWAVVAATVAVATGAVAVPVVTGGSGGGFAGCTGADVTTATFAARVTAATAGDVLCLTSGAYGTWAGTNKAITVKNASGATPTMTINFTTGDTAFTLDGMSGMGGNISNGATNITVKNSAFSSPLNMDGLNNSGVVIDSSTFINISACGHPERNCTTSDTTTECCRVHIPGCGVSGDTGMTIQNSLFSGRDTDGIQAGACAFQALDNEFTGINVACADPCNHADAMQVIGGAGSVIRGNWFHDIVNCLVAFDNLGPITFEDNVCEATLGNHSLELYGDVGSTFNHNTLMSDIVLGTSHEGVTSNGSAFTNNIFLGFSEVAAGAAPGSHLKNMQWRGTVESGGTDFVGAATFSGGGSPTTWSSGTAIFGGAAKPSTYAGYCLTTGSAGHNAGTDGLDVGIRC